MREMIEAVEEFIMNCLTREEEPLATRLRQALARAKAAEEAGGRSAAQDGTGRTCGEVLATVKDEEAKARAEALCVVLLDRGMIGGVGFSVLQAWFAPVLEAHAQAAAAQARREALREAAGTACTQCARGEVPEPDECGDLIHRYEGGYDYCGACDILALAAKPREARP